MLTGVSSCSGRTEMSLERYTRLLMDTSSAFPIHFLKIYSVRRCLFERNIHQKGGHFYGQVCQNRRPLALRPEPHRAYRPRTIERSTQGGDALQGKGSASMLPHASEAR